MWRAETNADRARAGAKSQAQWEKENPWKPGHSHRPLYPCLPVQERKDDAAYLQALEESDEYERREKARAEAEWNRNLEDLPNVVTVSSADIYDEAMYLRSQGNGVHATQAFWIALILGHRSAAIDIYEMLRDGESGVAKHRALAAVFLMIATCLAPLPGYRAAGPQDRQHHSGSKIELVRLPIDRDTLSAHLAHACAEAGSHSSAVRSIVDAITRTVEHSEKCLLMQRCSEVLAETQLRNVDEAVANAVRNSGDYFFPLGLGGYLGDEWSILDFLEIPEDLPSWQMSSACSLCDAKFKLFKRRHHCRNCGRSVCHTHSDNFFNRLLGGRPIPRGQEHRRGQKEGMARVCDDCHDLIQGFDEDGVVQEKVRPELPVSWPGPNNSIVDDSHYGCL